MAQELWAQGQTIFASSRLRVNRSGFFLCDMAHGQALKLALVSGVLVAVGLMITVVVPSAFAMGGTSRGPVLV